jgi:hypothetical protein
MARNQPRLWPSPTLIGKPPIGKLLVGELLVGELAATRGSRTLRTESALAAWLMPTLSVICLLWPALWNGYPIVFADTGTYLSQAMHRYLGWDRPAFYSSFIWPFHLGLTTWPVILAQSCLTVMVLDLTRRAFGLTIGWLLGLSGFLAVATWLPWTVSELMPDLFTPLMVLLLSLLVVRGSELRLWQRAAVTALAAFMIATQQSSVLLAVGLLSILIPLRRFAGATWAGQAARPDSWFGVLAPLMAPALALIALVLMNAVGFGRVSVSPYGNVFVLAQVIYDGPGMSALRRDCPDRSWRLCRYIDRFPATADEFLWDPASPVMLAGGHKVISAEADAIIRDAVIAQPGRLLTAAWDNTLEQLTRFASGDGLESWNGEVGSWIDRDFPAGERARFHAARQQAGTLRMPWGLPIVHRITALAGIGAALLLLPLAWHRQHVSAWFLAVALMTLPLSAAITGSLSTPHERYQSRIVWLPAAMAFLTVPALMGRRRPELA